MGFHFASAACSSLLVLLPVCHPATLCWLTQSQSATFTRHGFRRCTTASVAVAPRRSMQSLWEHPATRMATRMATALSMILWRASVLPRGASCSMPLSSEATLSHAFIPSIGASTKQSLYQRRPIARCSPAFRTIHLRTSRTGTLAARACAFHRSWMGVHTTAAPWAPTRRRTCFCLPCGRSP